MILIFLFSLGFSYEDPKETVIFYNDAFGSKFWRIPAIVKANDGTIVTSSDKRWKSMDDLPAKIDVVIRRSTDNGLTWEDPITITNSSDTVGYGDASLVVERETGNIICIFNGLYGFFQSTDKNPQHIFKTVSKDNGKTWSTMEDITHFLYSSLCDISTERKAWQGMFITSGRMLQLRSGRIMAVANVRKTTTRTAHNYAIYSDDKGVTWDVGIKDACDVGNEAKMVELNNGSILMSIRHKPRRFFTLSHDKGLTWDKYQVRDDFADPNTNGELIRYTSTRDGYDKNRLIHTNVNNYPDFTNLSIKVSYDEGLTWPVQKVLQPDGVAYSSAAILNDGTIAVYYERFWRNVAFNMTVATFSLDWLSDGKDKYTPPK